MREMINMVVDTFINFNGNSFYPILFVISILYIIIKKDEKFNKYLLILPSICIILIFLFPITAYVLSKILGAKVYWRILWLIPMILVIAYSLTQTFYNISNKTKKYLILLSFIFLTIFSNGFIFTSDNFNVSENIYKIPNAAIEICDIINEDCTKPKILVPKELLPYIKQYDGKIKMFYGRGAYTIDAKTVYFTMSEEIVDISIVTALSRNNECNYLVFNNNQILSDTPENYGYAFFKQLKNYIIYKLI